jgi:hypothetical protein|tara:strand:+ start:2035 stop:2346 length:312 start_codon:yes stop_codon:yes gene_type:complete
LALGCGISRKYNKKTNSVFLYYWCYKDGKKSEKYLGKVDDEGANLKGVREMLSHYRNQDKELHRLIGRLELQIAAGNTRKSTIPTILRPNTKRKPNYLPDFED